MQAFAHLHNHTQFSLLDGYSDIKLMYDKAVSDNMPAVAITDHGNMFGVFKFVAEASKYNKTTNVIKPIIGCEFYLVENRFKQQFTKQNKDNRFHQLMLAKNAIGYQNLCKLSSLSYIEGMYNKFPRIDKELILQYHEGLIATSCCLSAIIPKLIREGKIAEAEKELQWWLELFAEDYYIELQRHGLAADEQVNNQLLAFAKKYNIKTIATNDAHYIEKEDANAHDILLCINTGNLKSTPIMDDMEGEEGDQRGRRFGFSNSEFYFKSTTEMQKLFADIPESIENTLEIVDKIEYLELKKDILLPHFSVPNQFSDQDAYLRHLTYEGAYSRYLEVTPEITERIDFELSVIEKMGFAGYFLIVSDFIKAGRDIGVLIGPGRGSAAGSVVAFCTGITNIDPIKYNLLFERFLNPDRKSMPDIDTDFDDEGRQKVIEYVIDKYGKNQVAQIITYGTIAAKSSIRDVSRVMDLPLFQANELAKLVPERPGITLQAVLNEPLDSADDSSLGKVLRKEEIERVEKLRKIFKDNADPRSEILHDALKLEGSIRNVGVHAAGVIIAPSDLTGIIPVATAKDSDLVVTQYDGRVIENAGVIKMDILGLKTLSIIRDCLLLIQENHGKKIDIDKVALDDQETFELFQRGDTYGTFQFESAGMVKHLRDLKPDKLEDLISMNALFRPGPMAYIQTYIKRKHGQEEVHYDLPEMKEILEETYGITVYQEQVMLLSQKLANMTKGEADLIRKAMGKKDKKTLDSLYEKFIEGCRQNNLDEKICIKIWKDWEAFASYAFNKSHSTCYAYLAYQTAWLKAHYLPEFMAANLQHQISIEKITAYMQHAKANGLVVLGPDINESKQNFAVNTKGVIRFGLSAIKGIGGGPAQDILTARNEGPFTDIFDFVSRVNYQSINKKTLEALAFSGAFDQFNIPRPAFVTINEKGQTFIDLLIRYASAFKEQKEGNVMSLFGDDPSSYIIKPDIPSSGSMTRKEMLDKEKELIGIYASGHPLDDNKLELTYLCNMVLADLESLHTQTSNIRVGGMVTNAIHGTNKKGDPYCKVELSDFSGSYTFFVSGENYYRWKDILVPDAKIFVEAEYASLWNPDYLTFKPLKIQLLSKLTEEKIKSIILKIPEDKVTTKLTSTLQRFVNEYVGNQVLKIIIYDKDENITLKTTSNQKLIINQLLVEWAVNNGIEIDVESN